MQKDLESYIDLKMKGIVSMISSIPRDIAKATLRLEITLIVEETESLQSSMPLTASDSVKLNIMNDFQRDKEENIAVFIYLLKCAGIIYLVAV
ncbi:hypothetical protein Lser_V15G19503 [Lactuca serriola]